MARVLDGLPDVIQEDDVRGRIAALVSSLDAIGRLDVADGNAPMIDRHSFRMLLSQSLPAAQAESLINSLDALPGAAFRKDGQLNPIPREIPWYELAEKVVIFDITPAATFGELAPLVSAPLGGEAVSRHVMEEVRTRFPSLESELLDPRILPQRIRELWEYDHWQSWIGLVARQLGWWAGITASLMAAQAVGGAGEGTEPAASPSWPSAMFVLAAAIGGWTLTVVGDCALSLRI